LFDDNALGKGASVGNPCRELLRDEAFAHCGGKGTIVERVWIRMEERCSANIQRRLWWEWGR
jgi:hypothetical protein